MHVDPVHSKMFCCNPFADSIFSRLGHRRKVMFDDLARVPGIGARVHRKVAYDK